MSRLATSFVLGYHGCELEIAEKVVTGRATLLPSDKSYDWLGPGIYFWESDYQRAFEWAKARYGSISEPAVVGAVIDLGNCLDLLTRRDQGPRTKRLSFVKLDLQNGRKASSPK